MKSSHIKLLLWPVIFILAFFVYSSIQSEINFQKNAELRIEENIQKLKDLRALQIAYKRVNNVYANNLDSLMSFFYNDSMPIVKAEGETPDSLTDSEALRLGIISRDTAFLAATDVVFDESYLKNRNEKYPLNTDALTIIPFTEKSYTIDAGMVEKGNVAVQVFEISATYADVFTGLDAENKKYDLDRLLKVGSMNEASLNGNWGE